VTDGEWQRRLGGSRAPSELLLICGATSSSSKIFPTHWPPYDAPACSTYSDSSTCPVKAMMTVGMAVITAAWHAALSCINPLKTQKISRSSCSSYVHGKVAPQRLADSLPTMATHRGTRPEGVPQDTYGRAAAVIQYPCWGLWPWPAALPIMSPTFYLDISTSDAPANSTQSSARPPFSCSPHGDRAKIPCPRAPVALRDWNLGLGREGRD
jgi:hypothetical protein